LLVHRLIPKLVEVGRKRKNRCDKYYYANNDKKRDLPTGRLSPVKSLAGIVMNNFVLVFRRHAFSKCRLCSNLKSPTGARACLRNRPQKTRPHTLSVTPNVARSSQWNCGPV